MGLEVRDIKQYSQGSGFPNYQMELLPTVTDIMMKQCVEMVLGMNFSSKHIKVRVALQHLRIVKYTYIQNPNLLINVYICTM